MTDDPGEGRRRMRPRPWQTDWLVLRGMRRAIGPLADVLGRPGEAVLDFGCGDKPYEPLFARTGARYTGADFGDGADVPISPDGRVAVADGSFDVVVSFQVLEHVRDVTLYLDEVTRVLGPGGRLLLSTHGNWFYHPHPEDHRRWTREGLTSELASHGFDVLECHAVVGPLAYATVLRMTIMARVVRALPVVGRPIAAALNLFGNARGWLEDAITPTVVRETNAVVYVTLSRRIAA